MGKKLFIAEKPSVAREFAKVLQIKATNRDGYLESEDAIVTWCVGHLVTMSYPEEYDAKYKKWSLDTVPFVPDQYLYQIIPSVQKQFQIVSGLLNRQDVESIYVCTDSGREGEYIYRLVEMQAGVSAKVRKRVWIDSQTEDEIQRGIREAKDLSAYDNLASAAFLRAKEDYLMGINFSRVLTLKFGYGIKKFLEADRVVISVGRVMTCVLGMVVNREREVRNFVKTPFYRVLGQLSLEGKNFEAEWRSQEGSRYYNSPFLYKENGFLKRETAEELIQFLKEEPEDMTVFSIEKKKENKNPPLLYNLAELQNDCSRLFKISPSDTLRIVQELYEKKMVTYPRTDARVLSSAIAKEIHKNIRGMQNFQPVSPLAVEIMEAGSYRKIEKSRYVNDKQITDHYAIIPTGQGINNYSALNPTAQKIYELISRRFLSIFYPAAVYQKISLVTVLKNEKFFSTFKLLLDEGYLKAADLSFIKKKEEKNTQTQEAQEDPEKSPEPENGEEEGDSVKVDEALLNAVSVLKKGMVISLENIFVKEGETSPPKRYNSGTLILAMENAGQLIEDEELRAQIKGSGIGTSATRAEILSKLVNNTYLALNKKTQVITPTLLGELIFEVVNMSMKQLLDPKLTASWEKGLTLVADGEITEAEYMEKLDGFVSRRTNWVKHLNNIDGLLKQYKEVAEFYS